MARAGRPKAELVVSDEELLVLRRLAKRPKSAQAMAMRARIVLACAKYEHPRPYVWVKAADQILSFPRPLLRAGIGSRDPCIGGLTTLMPPISGSGH